LRLARRTLGGRQNITTRHFDCTLRGENRLLIGQSQRAMRENSLVVNFQRAVNHQNHRYFYSTFSAINEVIRGIDEAKS
jgi:hypothetical protein